MAYPTRVQLVANLDRVIAEMSQAGPELWATHETHQILTSLRDYLDNTADHGGRLSGEAVQEIAHAYLAGWREHYGPLDPARRRDLSTRLRAAGLTL